MMVMNVATYGFTIAAAHILGPQSYGALIAALNVLLIISVVSLGLQATAARLLASTPGQVRDIEASILRVAIRTSLLLGGVLLVLTPLLNRVLRLDSLPTAALIAVSAVPLTLMGGQAGILQGERRWAALGVVYLAAGVPRLVVGGALMLWQPSVFWGLAGVTLGFFAPVVAGWWALRRPRPEPPEPSGDEHGLAAIDVLREIVHNSQTLFAYFALSSIDVIVARNVLSAHDSGLYAAGLILAKAMLFLPQFVIVVAFPSLATPDERRRALGRSLGLVLVLGTAGTTAVWLLSDWAMVFVGGSEFAEIEGRLWLFALLGTVLSMIQLLVYAVLARRGRRTAWFVWLALVVLVGLGLAQSSLLGLVTTVLLVDVALLAVLLFVTAVRRPAISL